MNKLITGVAVLLLMAVFVRAQTGTVNMSASNIVDSTGIKLVSGTVYFAPTDKSGSPVSYHINGLGQALSRPVSTVVVNGAFNIRLPDTSNTSPANVCLSVTVIDNNTGENVLGGGYSCVQPTSISNSWCASGACNFDEYLPNLASIAIVQTGPTGATGPVGPAGPSGAFTQAGYLSAASYSGSFAAMMADPSTQSSTTTISGVMTVATNVTVSADRGIAVLSGGQFNCSPGVTITFLGDFNAQLNGQAFGANCNVAGLKWARPEWWGPTTGTNGTVSNAVNALASTGGDVWLQNANYRGGFNLLNPATGAANYMTKPNVHLHGTVRPAYASDYSALLSGTVIQDGMYVNANGFTAEHLGWDAGANVMAAYYPTFSALDSLEITSDLPNNPNHFPYLTGIRLEDVNCLGRTTSSGDHCLLVENVDGAYVHNVQTVYHTHGMVLKGINSVVDKVFSRGSISDGVIVKSDNYAPTSNDFISNVVIESLLTAGDTGGFEIDAEDAPSTGIYVSNLNVSSTSYGLEFLSDQTLTSVFVDGYGFFGANAAVPCMNIAGTTASANIQVTNFSCNNSLGFLLPVIGNYVQLTNGYFGAITGDAISITSASNVEVNNVIFNQVSGYAVNAVAPGFATVSQISTNATGIAGNTLAGFFLYSDAAIAIPFTFSNGWHNQGSSGNSIASYKLDRGRVYLGGTITPGTSTTVTTLPSNVRPLVNQRLIADGYNGTTFNACEIIVGINGIISVTNYLTCGTQYVALDGLSFWVSQY
jgi:hypothetical protein